MPGDIAALLFWENVSAKNRAKARKSWGFVTNLFGGTGQQINNQGDGMSDQCEKRGKK